MQNEINLLHPLWAEINLDNLDHNMKQIKKRIGSSNIIGIVKCNSYGHGSIEVSKEFINLGIKNLAVANVVEAVELRRGGIDCDIMVLGVSLDYTINTIIKYNIQPAVSSLDFAQKLNKEAEKNNTVCEIHIAIDTGMGRIGFRKNQKSLDDIRKICSMSNLKIVSMFSHFSTADCKDKSYTKFQLDIYNWFYDNLKDCKDLLGAKNISNSAAIMDLPDTHYDFVRPGIIQYGYYPSDEVNKDVLDLKPVLTWKSKIVHIKTMEANNFIGYGKNFETKMVSRIATIPVGYGDGYPKALSNKGYVIINGKLAPITGNVCMDQIMVDITDIDDVNVNDEVILLGRDKDVKFDADDFASLIGTINYEPLCLIGRRVTRVYIKNNEVSNIVYMD